MIRFRSLVPVPVLLVLAALGALWAPARETGQAGEPEKAAVSAQGRGNPRIHLQDGRDLAVNLGVSAAQRLKESGAPLSLSSADLDEDGVPDLLAGYAVSGGGALILWQGNKDSIHPRGPDALRRRESGELTESPFLPQQHALELPEPPQLLAAGDLDGDGHSDVLFTARGSARLYLLAGNGRGGFRELRAKDLPGAVTAMAAGVLDPRGGRLGVAVAVLTRRGPSLLLFDSNPFSETPESVALPAPATALALGQLDDDRFNDIAAVAGSELLLLHGRARAVSMETVNGVLPAAESPRMERRSLPFIAAALTAGAFGTGSREGLALLPENGRPYLLLPREYAAPERSDEEARVLALSRQQGQVRAPQPYLPKDWAQPSITVPTRVADLKDWALTETDGDSAGGGRVVVAARLSGSAADDLVVLDGTASRIHVVSAGLPGDGLAAGASRMGEPAFALATSLDVTGDPVAVLPMRLNPDARSDLVVLRSGSVAPAVVLTTSALTLTVDSTANTSDATPGNGICADSGGACTLRAAIQEANASAGADTINFAISGAGVHTISVTTQLPAITGAVTIDATTQPGYAGTPLIELSGPVSGSLIGLTIQVSDCVVRGLAVNTFHGTTGGIGIYIVTGGPLVKNALLEANFIGTDATGTIAKPNHLGISIQNTSLNTIGGTTAAARNLISGNDFVGIQIFGSAASGNIFQGNYIGTNVTGESALFNAEVGFNIFADSTLIGGAAAGAGNVISGNGDPAANTSEGHGGGIDLTTFCTGTCFGSNTIIKANRIGTNPGGTAAVGNLQHGIWIASPGAPNTTIANNLISGNGAWGIKQDDSLATVTTITGNFIGTNATGTAKIPNTSAGLPPGDPNTVAGILSIARNASVQVVIGGASGTTPGGPCTGSCNLISGNDPLGIFAVGSGLVTISNNYIGTNAAGAAELANEQGGVVLGDAPKVLGSSTASGNLISGNGGLFGGFGVLSQSTGSPGNTIKGNLIGTNAAGTAAVPNQGDGVILGASDTLGGVSDPNVISGNLGSGVSIPPEAPNARVLGNFIGVRSSGAALGNGFDGVTSNASDVLIQGNQIARNSGNGVMVIGSSSVRNAIRGNAIHHNAGLGIDLGGDGVTPNDAGDGDSGPNDLMNFPDGITTTWDSVQNKTTFRGHIDTLNPNTVSIDLFANSIHDPTDHGQGEAFLGSATPDANGYFCLTITGLPPFAVGTPP